LAPIEEDSEECARTIISNPKRSTCFPVLVLHSRLDQKFAAFLKKERGELSFSDFSRKMHIPRSTLYFAECMTSKVSLRLVEMVAQRLDVTLVDIFEDEATTSLKRAPKSKK
jgi:DNA-binding XRE family transcriptional regulator